MSSCFVPALAHNCGHSVPPESRSSSSVKTNPDARKSPWPFSCITEMKERSRRAHQSSSLMGIRSLKRHALTSMPISFQAAGDGKEQIPVRILCYGDSLTAGFYQSGTLFEPYGRSFSQTLGDAGIANEVSVCGLSGVTAKEMAGAVDGTLIDMVGFSGKGIGRIIDESRGYDFAVIMAGTNDIGKSDDTHSIVKHIARLHAACHSRGVSTVLATPPPAPCAGQQREGIRQQIVRLLFDMASKKSNIVSCFDSGDLIPRSGANLWDKDGLHFSCVGSRSFGKRLAIYALESVLEEAEQSSVPVVESSQASVARHVTPTRSIASPAESRSASSCAVVRRAAHAAKRNKARKSKVASDRSSNGPPNCIVPIGVGVFSLLHGPATIVVA